MSRLMDFPGMHADEQIVLFRRRHWTLLSRKLLLYVFLLLLPFIVFTLLNWSNVEFIIDSETPSGVAIVLGVSAFALILWLLFFHDWLDYYLDALIVTNERIVRIEQHGLFDRTVADLALNRIQDVTVEVKGMLGTFLRYGTISIQSAAEQARFEFTDMPEPELVKAEILKFVRREPTQKSEDASGRARQSGQRPTGDAKV